MKLLARLRRLRAIFLNTVIGYRNSRICYYSQFSARWYFRKYGWERLGDVGCGPVVCAIATSTLTDRKVTPVQAARWAYSNGYYAYQRGSLHKLIPDWCAAYGIRCEDLNGDVKCLAERLASGNSLGILLCRRGVFSGGNHFVTVGRGRDGYKVYNSANVFCCYKSFTIEQLEDAIVKDELDDGPVWWLSPA